MFRQGQNSVLSLQSENINQNGYKQIKTTGAGFLTRSFFVHHINTFIYPMDFPLYKFDDELIRAAVDSGAPKVLLTKWNRPIVVIGKGGKAELELNLPAIASGEIEVFRRYGGGCSVVIDEGQVVISAVIPGNGILQTKKYFQSLTDWIINGLSGIGITGVEKAGSSDLAIGGRKISGSSIYATKEFTYYTATIILDANGDTMEKYLKHPPREPDYRIGRRHSDFVIGLKNVSDYKNTEEFMEALGRVLDEETLVKTMDDKL